MNKAYVSEFEIFMDQYMKDHPEEVINKLRGWREFWQPGTSRSATNLPPKDPYGLF